MSRRIYLRTKFAWYILGQPSKDYLPFFSAFWTRHFIFHTLLMSASANPNLTMQDFKSLLEELDEPLEVVGTPLGPQHIHSQSTVSTFTVSLSMEIE